MPGNTIDILSFFDRKRRLYRRVYATPDGKSLIDDILSSCGFWRGNTNYYGQDGRLDPLALAAAEGKREIATHIMKHLGVSDVEMQLRLKGAQSMEDSRHELQ